MKVIYAPNAIEDFNRIYKFIEGLFSTEVADELEENYDQKLEMVKKFPTANPKSESSKGLRKFDVKRRTIVFFEIHDDCIEIVSMYDSREDRPL